MDTTAVAGTTIGHATLDCQAWWTGWLAAKLLRSCIIGLCTTARETLTLMLGGPHAYQHRPTPYNNPTSRSTTLINTHVLLSILYPISQCQHGFTVRINSKNYVFECYNRLLSSLIKAPGLAANVVATDIKAALVYP